MADLLTIPGIGPSLKKDLQLLGYSNVEDLKGENPESMYAKLCDITRVHQDPCVLYTFRCAVYFASTKNPNPKKLKWWWWKGQTVNTRTISPR
jgi:hypothetical protein